MITSFTCKETERIFHRHFSKKFPPDIQLIAFRKLRMLHHAHTLQDISVPPGNRLERLQGNREQRYSVRINAQFRLCFVWIGPDCPDVGIVDYH